MRREAPVRNAGEHYPLPYTGEGSWGLGKPLRPITHPLRADLPIFLGAEGPKNVALAAEVCDGWLPLYYSPYNQSVYEESLAGCSENFEVIYGLQVNVTDSVEEGLKPVKEMLSFYIGGMGSKKRNFHRELVARMGYEKESLEVQELFMTGRRKEAAHAIPDSLADEISLVGPPERIRDRLQAFDDSPVTMLMISRTNTEDLKRTADLLLS